MASSSAPRWKYQVFLSFRGESRDFITRIYEKLQERAISAFKDDIKLEKGTSIGKELMLAIEQSRFSIVVLSKGYASSAWCLLELAHIVQCMKESGRIMPIFYDVDPSHVRHQSGSFAQDFAKHEKNKLGKKVQEWRDAFTKLGNFSGWDSRNYRNEMDLIEEIVEAVWRKIHPEANVKLEKIDFLLSPEENDVRFIGIWGKDEIGITTTAQLVHRRINVGAFELSSFLRKIKQLSKDKSLVFLQAQLLGHLKKKSTTTVSDVYTGNMMIKDCVLNRKVLRILDDVGQSDQLQILIGDKDWYGEGSRIIVTSMYRELLIEYGIEEPYLVEGLSKDEALKLRRM